MKKKIAIIDICGTLFDSNTTFDFLDYYIHTWTYRWLRQISRCVLWKIINKTLRKVWAIDLTRIIALRYLRGYSKQQLILAAEQFYDNVLIYKIQHPVCKFVEELKRKNYDLILVSATLDCIAVVVAKKMGIEQVYSSKLSYSEFSICDGFLQEDLLGAKIEYLRRAKVLPPFSMVLTDDLSDIELLKNASECVVVSKKSKGNIWIKYLREQAVYNYQLMII